MSNKDTVDLVEEWQTGVFFIIGCVIIGVIAAVIGGSVGGHPGALVGLLGGVILGFLALSYLRYGR